MGFEPITTQEQFDAIVNPLLEKARRESAKEATKPFTDYDSLKKKVDELSGAISEKDATITALTRKELQQRVAREEGLPYELANRLSGDGEAEMREDAQSLAKFISGRNQPVPLKKSEPEGDTANTKDSALKTLLSNLQTD